MNRKLSLVVLLAMIMSVVNGCYCGAGYSEGERTTFLMGRLLNR